MTNRDNAQHSTGPKTEAGKNRSKLNALRHGLTGQVVILTEEDRLAHAKFTDPIVKRLAPVDVVERKESLVVPQLYDGRRLPFEDRAFDLAYAVDVLHHCPDPLHAIDDMARCAKRYLLIKDHTYHTAAGRWTLAVLDELGNRRFGIPSPYLYQQDWRWVEHLESRGWRRVAFEHPLACHTGPLAVTNRLQWIALWERR